MTVYLFRLTECRKVNDLKKVERKEIPNKAKAFEPREIEIKTKNKINSNQVDFNKEMKNYV